MLIGCMTITGKGGVMERFINIIYFGWFKSLNYVGIIINKVFPYFKIVRKSSKMTKHYEKVWGSVDKAENFVNNMFNDPENGWNSHFAMGWVIFALFF